MAAPIMRGIAPPNQIRRKATRDTAKKVVVFEEANVEVVTVKEVVDDDAVIFMYVADNMSVEAEVPHSE